MFVRSNNLIQSHLPANVNAWRRVSSCGRRMNRASAKSPRNRFRLFAKCDLAKQKAIGQCFTTPFITSHISEFPFKFSTLLTPCGGFPWQNAILVSQHALKSKRSKHWSRHPVITFSIKKQHALLSAGRFTRPVFCDVMKYCGKILDRTISASIACLLTMGDACGWMKTCLDGESGFDWVSLWVRRWGVPKGLSTCAQTSQCYPLDFGICKRELSLAPIH